MSVEHRLNRFATQRTYDARFTAVSCKKHLYRFVLMLRLIEADLDYQSMCHLFLWSFPKIIRIILKIPSRLPRNSEVDTKTGRLDKTIAPYSSRPRAPSPAFVIPCKLLITAPHIFVLCFAPIAHPLHVNPKEKYYYLQICVGTYRPCRLHWTIFRDHDPRSSSD